MAYNLYFTDYVANRKAKEVLSKEKYIDYVKKVIKHNELSLKSQYSEETDWYIHLAEQELKRIKDNN